jgi:ABC-type Co2+ transport system permease subunit
LLHRPSFESQGALLRCLLLVTILAFAILVLLVFFIPVLAGSALAVILIPSAVIFLRARGGALVILILILVCFVRSPSKGLLSVLSDSDDCSAPSSVVS